MVHLVIRVIGSAKWVTVEDLSGPVIKFNDRVEAQPKPGDYSKDAVVDIHSTPTRPGRAVVYAGRRESDRSVKFYCENLTRSCVLKISDDDLRPRSEDSAGFADCECRKIALPREKESPPEQTEAEQSAGDRARADAGADATSS